MPRFYTYGVHAFLQLCDSPNATSAGTILAESPPTVKWSPMQGMTHPVSTTTVVSPAKASSRSPIPFRIVINFSPDARPLNGSPPAGPDHLKGDVRIEVRIDGIVRGWRILPQPKIWPKGVRIEFSGSRVGRTEERAFVFSPLPLDAENSTYAYSLPSPPAPAPDTPDMAPLLGSEDPTLSPHTPSELPSNASHIQILITLGKKHNTLEKYLIFSPVLQEAFYVPPSLTSSTYEESEGNMPNPIRGTKRKAGTSPRIKKKEAKTSLFHKPSRVPFIMAKKEEPKGVKESTNVDTSETAEWKPVGLAEMSQKTTQMREAEFTARIHLARFWFYVVPNPIYMLFQPQASSGLITLSGAEQNFDESSSSIGSKAKILDRTKVQKERGQNNLEDSNAGEGKGQAGVVNVTKNTEIGVFSSSLHTEVEDSERQSFETRYQTARDHYLNAADQFSTDISESETEGRVSHPTEHVDDLIDSANLNKNRWTAKMTIEEGVRDIFGEDAQESEKINGLDQGLGGGILRSGSPKMLLHSNRITSANKANRERDTALVIEEQ